LEREREDEIVDFCMTTRLEALLYVTELFRDGSDEFFFDCGSNCIFEEDLNELSAKDI
jgi:hypothetical protein